jgi:hypothetical protein
MSQGPRVFIRSKATCAAPLREVLTPCRGRRPHHEQKDRISGKTRAGKFQLKRKTRRDRMQAKLRMIKGEMWRRMHQPIPAQGKWLWHVVRGYFNHTTGWKQTGVFLRLPELAEKQVELLTQAFPDKTRLAMLWDGLSFDQFDAAENRAKLVGLQVLSTKLEHPPYDFDAAFRSMIESSPQMLLILSSPRFITQRQRIADLAIRHRLPAMSIFKFYVEAGVLMSYGVDTVLPFRRAGHHVAKVLRGAKPTNLPVEQVTNFETAINLKTAKAIGIELPTSILLRADEVIE